MPDLNLRAERPVVALRPPSEVMRLARMGSFFATRLSFMRILIRELIDGGWEIGRERFDLDRSGYGTAVYRVANAGRSYCLVAFSHYLDPARRTDRVIAEAWDATFALFDGDPSPEDIARLKSNVPRQEAGRYRASELVLARANRSLRLFDHTVERLSQGLQPDEVLLRGVGYLMRTTAVYGNGKFGIADRFRIAGRHEFEAPFQAEMLAVYLVRLFTIDLVEHVARMRDPGRFAPLDMRYRRYLGIGNSTGLGMAPFLMTHPALLSNWMVARETALALARSAASFDHRRLVALLSRARRHLAEWNTDDVRQMNRIVKLRQEMALLAAYLPLARTPEEVFQWGITNLGLEGQELVATLLIEILPARANRLAKTMSAVETLNIDGAMTVAEAAALIEKAYDWALKLNMDDPAQRARFWYVSEEKLEPRLGNRYEEKGAELERPFAIAHDMRKALADLKAVDGRQTLAEFLMRHPGHRHAIRRLQIVGNHPYGEIRDNLVAADCLPIDILRCKLSIFGAVKFDPKSDRWTRIAMYQGAPLPEDLASPEADDWAFPFL